MNRFLAQAMALVLLAASLVGCGSSETIDATAAPNTDSAQASATILRTDAQPASSQAAQQVLQSLRDPATAKCGDSPVLWPCNGQRTCNVLCCSGAHITRSDTECGDCLAWGRNTCGHRAVAAAWWSE